MPPLGHAATSRIPASMSGWGRSAASSRTAASGQRRTWAAVARATVRNRRATRRRSSAVNSSPTMTMSKKARAGTVTSRTVFSMVLPARRPRVGHDHLDLPVLDQSLIPLLFTAAYTSYGQVFQGPPVFRPALLRDELRTAGPLAA